MEDTLSKIIMAITFIVIGCAIIWGIGAFVTYDLKWFLNCWLGRLIASIMFIIILSASIKAVSDDL